MSVEDAGAAAVRENGAEIAAAAVTVLFVPGDRPDRFRKAAAAGADVVIIDLEDAVAPATKVEALAAVQAALSPTAEADGVRAMVRVNAMGSQHYDAEIAALLNLATVPGSGLLGLVVPKAEDGAALGELRAQLPASMALVALIESAAGVVNAPQLARIKGITRLAFGAIDFALDINAGGGDRFLDYARAHLVLASRAAGIAAPLDSPEPEIKDIGRVDAAAQLARNFGFGGKLCIHPSQLASVRAGFAPTEADIDWAHSVIDAEGGAVQLDGQMIDRPVTERAKRILQRAGQEQ